MGGAVLSAAISLAARIVFPVGGVFQRYKTTSWIVVPRDLVNHIKRNYFSCRLRRRQYYESNTLAIKFLLE